MSTPKQIAASRANGARSKGPATEPGKRNSSRNSTRHGLFAETIVLQDEKEHEFIELVHELLDEHQPQTPTETMLVEAIAAARWRQDRIWGMQKVAFDHDVASSSDTSASPPLRAVLALRGSPDNIRSHELLLRYEIAFDRQISRALLRLHQLQDRNANRRQERMARPAANEEPIRTEEPIGTDPVLYEVKLSPKSDARLAGTDEPAALRAAAGDSRNAPAKRTPQSTETNDPMPDSTLRKLSPAPRPVAGKPAHTRAR